jgi:hypothetical protein
MKEEEKQQPVGMGGPANWRASGSSHTMAAGSIGRKGRH